MLPQSQHYDHTARLAEAARPATPAPRWYSSIPRRLLTDMHDTPLAIGMYALIARLFVIGRAPVPLSRADVLRYDPSLKPGAVKRAFDRLLHGGWLLQAEDGRQKHAYTPSWGRVNGTALPWDLQDACHGRPRHVQRLMLDRNLFDICMGKLTPHAALSATVTRYMTAPALSLSDIGCYALTLADSVRPTPALRWLGLIQNDQARPLPSEQRLLAIISQQTFTLDERIAPYDTELTLSGTRRIGLASVTPPNPHDGTAQPLFFVPPRLIGNLIGSLIGGQIGAAAQGQSDSTAAAMAETPLVEHTQPITWESLDTQETRNPLLPPHTAPATTHGGGREGNVDQKQQPRRRSRPKPAEPPAIPKTESAQLLQSMNTLPEQVLELASMPIETIQAAIADGKARSGIRDLAGWVVTLLRAHRDHGWAINPPAAPADSPEALRMAFARYASLQEAGRREGMPDDQAWFPPPAPALLHLPGAPIRLWNDVQAALKHQLARSEFNTWIRHSTLMSLDHGLATIMVPSALVKQVIEERYLSMLRDMLRMYVGEALELCVILNPSALEQTVPETALLVANTAPLEKAASGSPLQPNSDECPDWITAERWIALPMMLRAALLGSELIDGAVQGRSAFLSRLLATRYAREVEALIRHPQR